MKIKNILKLLILPVYIFVITGFTVFAASSFSANRLEQEIISTCNDYFSSEIKVTLLKSINDCYFEENNVEAEIEIVEKQNSGLYNAIVSFTQNQNLIKSITIPIKVREINKIAVAGKNLIKGNIVAKEDITFVESESNFGSKNNITNSNQIVGQKLKSNLVKGTPISISAISNAVSISKGTKVVVICKSEAVIVRTMGTALNDANEGEQVRIQREGSKDVIIGILEKDGSVVIASNN
jgi:flagella basal body P-ring formation protein FlgA